MKIAQLVHTLAYGDAISSEAISITKLLGSNCKIYCLNAHPRVKEYANEVDVDGIATADVVLMHYSIGSPLNKIYQELKNSRRILLYHNLTPVKWFESYNYRVATDLSQGLSELPGLLAASDLILADSTFNKEELLKMGCKKEVQVFPLLFERSKWSIDANPGIAQVLSTNDCVNFLSVGRLAPNKCVEDIIKIFYFYHYKINKKSALWIIGHEIDTEIYAFELKNLAINLRLSEKINFVGSVADTELKAFYQNSDAYICMSEHEGFCVPVIEAMSLGLPVLAYGSSALPETLGDGGVLVDHKRHAEIAEILNILATDSELKKDLISRASKQAEKFSEENFSKSLTSILASIIACPK